MHETRYSVYRFNGLNLCHRLRLCGADLGDDAHVDVLGDTSGATLALEVDALQKGKVFS